ncbi:MAG: efflux RND transporter periplasmic adaptor subunit [Pseudomonadota bacterium]
MMKRHIFLIMAFIACALIFLAAGAWWRGPSQEPERAGSGSLVPVADAADAPLSAGMIDPKNGKKIKYWAAPMDPTYIRNAPGKSPMGMDLVPVYEEAGGEKEPASTIRIDPVTVQNMGVRTDVVTRRPLNRTIRTYGNVTYDETRIYSVNTKFDGWIERIYVNFEGERVKKGQPLFDIYSPELVSAQEEYLLALGQSASLGDSTYSQIREGAARLLAASRTRLSNWDLTPGQIDAIGKKGRVRKNLTVYSPASGVVTAKKAIDGSFVKAGMNQYEIADLSRVWVDAEVYEYELPWVHQGMPASMALSYLPGRQFEGRVLFIYPYLTAKTRTARLRLQFDNADGDLKPDMYANVTLLSSLGEDGLVIPQEAVIDSGVRKVVFIDKGKGRFEPREIKTGVEVGGDSTQVISGLSEGERIVISAQFMLDSESRLREAIQKMLDVRQKDTASGGDAADMSGVTMDTTAKDLDMSNIGMDTPPPSK